MDRAPVLPHQSPHTNTAVLRWWGGVNTVRPGWGGGVIITWMRLMVHFSLHGYKREHQSRRITVNWRPHERQRGTPWDRESSVRTAGIPRQPTTQTSSSNLPLPHHQFTAKVSFYSSDRERSARGHNMTISTEEEKSHHSVKVEPLLYFFTSYLCFYFIIILHCYCDLFALIHRFYFLYLSIYFHYGFIYREFPSRGWIKHWPSWMSIWFHLSFSFFHISFNLIEYKFRY